MFIDIEVTDEIKSDKEAAEKLAETCPVDIYAQDDGGTLEIVDANVDECMLCDCASTPRPRGRSPSTGSTTTADRYERRGPPDERLAVIGSGTIACGLAATAARRGLVTLWARSDASAERAERAVRRCARSSRTTPRPTG